MTNLKKKFALVVLRVDDVQDHDHFFVGAVGGASSGAM